MRLIRKNYLAIINKTTKSPTSSRGRGYD